MHIPTPIPNINSPTVTIFYSLPFRLSFPLVYAYIIANSLTIVK
nr:MAG TPA: hypothetical protein [Caudoviricetes sp.]